MNEIDHTAIDKTLGMDCVQYLLQLVIYMDGRRIYMYYNCDIHVPGVTQYDKSLIGSKTPSYSVFGQPDLIWGLRTLSIQYDYSNA